MALVPPRDWLGRRPRRRHGPRQDGADASRCMLAVKTTLKDEGKKFLRAHRGADERRHQLAARDGQVLAVAQVRALARGRAQGAAGRARGRRRRHHELRAPPPRRGAPREDRLALRHPRRGAEHQEPAERHRRARPSASGRTAGSPSRGTPIENRLSRDLVASSTSCRPGLLGPLDKFEERYSRPIDAGDTKAAQRLRATIHPFILRRTKSEVAKDLPEKIETDQILRAHRRAVRALPAVLKEVRAQVLGEVERQGWLAEPAPDPRGPHAPQAGRVRPAPARASARSSATRTPESSWPSASSFRRASRAGTACSSSASSSRCCRSSSSAIDEDGVELRVPRRLDQGPASSASSASSRTTAPGLPHLAQGRRQRPEPHRRRHRHPLRPVVEPRGRGPGDRPRPPHRPDEGRHGLPASSPRAPIEEKILELGGKKRELVGAVLTEDMGGAKKLTKTDLEDLFKLD